MTFSCDACSKSYSSKYNLSKHHKRQPLCVDWIKLQPGIKDYIDDKFQLPIDEDALDRETKCGICNTIFANVGNLNRHLDTSTICSKWSLYRDLEPLHTYIRKPELEESLFFAPKHKLCHIIWNLFLIDKELKDIPEIITENNIKYIIGILPDQATYDKTFPPGIDHHIMLYDDHSTNLNITEFDEQCQKIEEYRSQRANIFICCNSGYQRSIPFLCYYLIKYHPEEVPNIAKAIDLILPQVDKQNYATLKEQYVMSTEMLFLKIPNFHKKFDL